MGRVRDAIRDQEASLVECTQVIRSYKVFSCYYSVKKLSSVRNRNTELGRVFGREYCPHSIHFLVQLCDNQKKVYQKD
jgi:hypothetical protein